MSCLPHTSTNRRAFAACGLLLCAVFYLELFRAGVPVPINPVPEILSEADARLVLPERARPLLPLYRSDPLAYFQASRADYENRVRDYVCRLTKQELLAGELSEEQVTEVKFREGPFSVFMHVVENPGRARRVLYVEDRFVNDGHQMALIEPQSALARLLVNSVLRPIDGKDAQIASRRLISEFGFGRSLDLIIRYAELSDRQGRLDLRYVGESNLDGRPTLVFERRLPVDDGSGQWPDALLVVHMDQEWNLPVACYSYADPQGTRLLGKYLYSDVTLNVGLGAEDFEPSTYGL